MEKEWYEQRNQQRHEEKTSNANQPVFLSVSQLDKS